MKAILPALAIGGLLGLASLGAHAADGTITITGTITDTTCSINGTKAGGDASKQITLDPVTASSLAALGQTAGTSKPTDLAFKLSGCTTGTRQPEQQQRHRRRKERAGPVAEREHGPDQHYDQLEQPVGDQRRGDH
jgi:type 1 fimbria pilin